MNGVAAMDHCVATDINADVGSSCRVISANVFTLDTPIAAIHISIG